MLFPLVTSILGVEKTVILTRELVTQNNPSFAINAIE